MIVSVLRCPLYRDAHCLQTSLLIFKLLPTTEQKILCVDSQQTSGWHINDNRWRNREYRYMLSFFFFMFFRPSDKRSDSIGQFDPSTVLLG